MDYDFIPLKTMLDNADEQTISALLSTFRCSRDRDLENFLHKSAVPNEKRGMARTYLALSSDDRIVGYFSLSMRCGVIPKQLVSKSMYKRLNVQPETDVAQMYLIGQLGRSDDSEHGLGESLIKQAMGLIARANEIVGCRVMRIDCKPSESLIAYYHRFGFEAIKTTSDGELTMMVSILKPQFPSEPEV